MKIHSPIILSFIFLTLCLPPIAAQQYEAALDALLTEFSETTTGGTVLIAKNGNVLYRKAFGMANREFLVKMEPGHIHRIGSLTKQFTAAAILKLQEEGKLSVKEDITKYIGDYPTLGHTITIEHLLTHTSGIANYTAMPKFKGDIRKKDHTPLELINFFKDEPMDFAPGDEFKYNNSGYIILGHIIESVTGQTYGQFLEETFFQPLGMKHTGYDSSSKIIENRVPGYSWENGAYRNTAFLSMTLPYAGGSLLSTVDDLFIWNQAIMENKVLTKESKTKARSPYLLNNGKPTNYGYGLRLGQIQDSPTLKHGGTVNGFSSYAISLPREKIFIARLTNCDCSWDIETTASKMVAIVMDSPYTFEKQKVSKKALKALQGRYSSPGRTERIIRYEDGGLVFFRKGSEKSQLIPFEAHKFQIGKSLDVIVFKKDTNGFILKGLDNTAKWQKTDGKVTAFESVALPMDVLEKYLGEYRLSPKRVFKVIAEEGTLFGQMGPNKEEILPLDRERFYAKSIDAQLIFDLDEDGLVIGLTIFQGKPKKALKIN